MFFVFSACVRLSPNLNISKEDKLLEIFIKRQEIAIKNFNNRYYYLLFFSPFTSIKKIYVLSTLYLTEINFPGTNNTKTQIIKSRLDP